jgi:hypothetical protein
MLIDMPPETLRAIIPAVGAGVGLPIEGQVEKVIHRLFATLPMKQEDDAYSVFGRIVGTDYSRALIEILKLTAFLLSNKLLYGEKRVRDRRHCSVRLEDPVLVLLSFS